MVVSFPVVGSFLSTETTQHPHPPSPHIFLVPDSPYCDLIHSFNVVFGSALGTCTLPPLRVNDTLVVGESDDDIVIKLNSAATLSLCLAARSLWYRTWLYYHMTFKKMQLNFTRATRCIDKPHPNYMIKLHNYGHSYSGTYAFASLKPQYINCCIWLYC